MLDINNANRGTEMSLIGKLICAWKGSHKWRNPRKKEIFNIVNLRLSGITDTDKFSVCDRCGATRPIKPRTRKTITKENQQ